MERSPGRIQGIPWAKAVSQGITGMLLVSTAPVSCAAQSPEWHLPPRQEQLLAGSLDGWEPALAVGPRGEVIIVAGRREGAPKSDNFDQKLVLWRSDDAGVTFEGPWPLDQDAKGGHWDQRVAIDANGVIYVSYIEIGEDRVLRLARSRDGGRTFSVETVTPRVSDKPELAVSADGDHIYIVYELEPEGPTLVASHDGGASWGHPRLVVPSEGRHFWPEALALAPDGGLWFAAPSMSREDIWEQRETAGVLHVFRSTDDGRSWQDFDFGSSPRIVGGCVHDPECPVVLPRVGVAVDAQNQAYVAYTEGAARQPYGLFVKSSSDGGRTWSERQAVSDAPRPKSGDAADYGYPMITASGEGRVCVAWVDDRQGALNLWALCSGDGVRSWGPEFLLSDRSDGASYKSAEGFAAFYGHYGDVAIDDVSGRLHAVWAAGEPGYRTGGVWVNSVDLSRALER